MQYPNDNVALHQNWNGVAINAKAINVRVANQNNFINPNITFEVEYHWNGWVEKDGINANLVLCNQLNFR